MSGINCFQAGLLDILGAFSTILDLVVTRTKNGIPAQLNPCSGNSTVGDSRRNKGSVLHLYPCLRKDGGLARKLLLEEEKQACGSDKEVNAPLCSPPGPQPDPRPDPQKGPHLSSTGTTGGGVLQGKEERLAR